MSYTIADAEQQIKRLRQEWDSFVSKNFDRHGARLTNCGQSVDYGDYVIRGEVNDLILDAIQNLDQITIDAPQIVQQGGGGLQNPLIESILASQDNTYDIGQSGTQNRIRHIFSYVTNSEKLEVTDDNDHSSHWDFRLQPANTRTLQLLDNSAAVFATFNRPITGERFMSVEADILPLTDNTYDLGGSILSLLWASVWSSTFLAGKSGVPGFVRIHDGSSGYKDITTDGDGFVFEDSLIPDTASAHDLGTAAKPWDTIYVNTISGGGFLTNPLTSSLLVDSNGVYDLGQSGINPRFRNAYTEIINTENVEITDSSHSSHWDFQLQSGNNRVLQLIDNASTVFAAFNRPITGERFLSLKSDIIPIDDNTYELGGTILNYIWKSVRGGSLLVGKGASVQGNLSIYNTTSASGFSVRGVRKDNENAIEIQGNNSIDMADGNFYNRVISGGDVDCTNVSDGWTGFRSDTNELQICVGGSVVKVTLS